MKNSTRTHRFISLPNNAGPDRVRRPIAWRGISPVLLKPKGGAP